ncbi:guanine nucleotide exchange factor subunit Rich [Ischnura elegans]|uniref:guanine nucleotide exchange factor subunit Rich n=1 Tax=Ischnura elegans TaxID=197161 RepID=UPI001ED8A66E|nr:guanine nucleotide exchange factor subunit Rich [Ischnura elegans]
MYFPIGWPKVINVPQLGLSSIRQVVCNRDKLLLAILTDDSLSIWYCKPCVPIVLYRRSQESVDDVGMNELVEWRPDSSMLVVATSVGHLLFYHLSRDKGIAKKNGLYEQKDSPRQSLRRDSAELFIQEAIPALSLTSGKVSVGVGGGGVTSLVCIRDELMVATTRGTVLRYGWDGHLHRDHCLDLRRIPFCNDQQVSKAIPILEPNTYVVDIEYSPLVGGFAVVLSDGRAAFLTASSLKFDPNQVQGIWAQNIDDATCAAVNHKYRLIAFGRKNSQGVVFGVDERTGGLEETHRLVLSGRDSPGQGVGPVRCMRWTPDGRALALAWGCAPKDSSTPLLSPSAKSDGCGAPTGAGLSVWSTYGALLMCTLGWGNQTSRMGKLSPESAFVERGGGGSKREAEDYLLNIHSLEWSAEGYQLWMVQQPCLGRSGVDHHIRELGSTKSEQDSIIVLDFVKSALTVNPCMSHQGHICLQGDDRLYINLGGRVGGGRGRRGRRSRAPPSSPHHSSSSRSSSTTSSSFSSPLPILPNHFGGVSARGVAGARPGGVHAGVGGDEDEGAGGGDEEDEEEGGGMGVGGRGGEGKAEGAAEAFMGSKQWIVVPIPSSYLGTNWPIRYAAVGADGQGVVVAGRTGLAHVTLPTCRWRLFGNETQERDFAVTGGLLWWKPCSNGRSAVALSIGAGVDGGGPMPDTPSLKDGGPVVIVAGVYNVARDRDEVRAYPREGRLEDSTAGVARVGAQVLLLDALGPTLVAFTADARLCLIRATMPASSSLSNGFLPSSSSASLAPPHGKISASSAATGYQGACLELVRLQEIDISALCIHAACVVSVSLTSLRAETTRPPPSNARLTCWKRHRKKSRLEEDEEEAMLGEEEEFESAEEDEGEGGEGGGGEGELESIVLNVSGRLMMVQRDRGVEVDEEGGEGSGDSGDGEWNGSAAVPPFRWVGAQQGATAHGGSVDGELVGATVLASGVEGVWAPRGSGRRKPQLRQALWLYCGAAGARVWLPLLPRPGRRAGHEGAHSFMAKRIMLPFQLRIYPLAILFEDAILLGAESDTTVFSSDPSLPFSLPFCVVERTSQVYLHQILRQLLRRNLGFHAWEIARSCTSLPYFPHSLELLLHEVLEEEATSKDPLPDALLPGVVEFIGEFPRERPRCIVQCARKTEVALWPCLFAAVGRPRTLFEHCLAAGQLRTAASYLIILQNLESSSVSRQHATQLLDAALEQGRWELSRELVRFLRAIDPMDVESPRASFSLLPSKFGVGSSHPPTPAVCPNEEDLSLLLGTMQVSRGRSFSTTSTPKTQGWGSASLDPKVTIGSSCPEPSPLTPVPQASSGSAKAGHREVMRSNSESRSVGGSSSVGGLTERIRKKSEPGGSTSRREEDEEPYLDLVVQRHARKLLKAGRLGDLGRLSAWHAPHFGLVSWLRSEKEDAARLPHPPEVALRSLHANLRWPFPNPPRSPSSLSCQNLPSVMTKLSGDSRSSSSGIHSLPTPADEGVSSFEVKRGSFPSMKAPQLLPTGITSADVLSQPRHGQVLEAQLMPHLITSPEEQSYRSEESLWWGEEGGEDGGSLWGGGNGRDDSCMSEVDGVEEIKCQPASSDGPSAPTAATYGGKVVTTENGGESTSRTEVQLRYLHQLFVEARCLEWALVVSIALRDIGALARTVRAALKPPSLSSPPPEIEAARLRDILTSLYQWSASQCLVYKPFLSLAYGHVAVLSKHAAGASAVPQSEEPRASHVAVQAGPDMISSGLASNVRSVEGPAEGVMGRLESTSGDGATSERTDREWDGATRKSSDLSAVDGGVRGAVGDGRRKKQLEQCEEEECEDGEGAEGGGRDEAEGFSSDEEGLDDHGSDSNGGLCVVS